ncbi:MAG: UDP-forming cellulose synthase catalytic subunit [Verrucomicrobiota bacterium]
MVFFWFLSLLAFLFVCSLHLEHRSQWYLAGALLLGLFFFRSVKRGPTVRVIFLCFAVFLVLRYLFWRSLQTLEFYDWLSFSIAIILFLAEVYGILIFLLGSFVNIRPFERKPVPLPPEDQLPTVDVMVPSYNESEEILEVTLMAALQMQYPEQKRRIYLLDDGGTDQKCTSGSDASREQALTRRESLFRLCQRLGVQYMTRERNQHAKAGNINEAMKKTSGDLLLILDADHVPTENFLENTVGLFNEDEKLFLVQTPHFFVNPDPIEKNLNTFYSAPSENEMFYRVVQQGLDYWNSSFFCGSGALLRRSLVEAQGGMSGETITEDAETALSLHGRGYNSAFISEPMLSGLQPETMGGFIGQRIRWATGMVQIFLLKRPLLMRGLSLPQRLCYVNSCSFWFFPFARLVFLLAPVAFLVFGLKIYAANWQTFSAYAVPHLVAVLTVSSYLYGRVRRSFVSELYELIQSVYCLPAIVKTMIRPRAPAFQVTPKGEYLDRTYISPLSFPFYILFVINITALIFGTIRYFSVSEQTTATLITMGFGFFNTVILLAAIGALLERQQRRSNPRMPVNLNAKLLLGNESFDCRIVDISLGGCRILLKPAYERDLEKANNGLLQVTAPGRKVHFSFNVDLRILRYDEDSELLSLGTEFNHKDLEERKQKVRFVTGSSDRWMNFQKNRECRLGVIGSFLFLLGIGVKYSLAHFGHLLGSLFGGSRPKSSISQPENV